MHIEKLMHDEMSHQQQVLLHEFSKWLLSVGDRNEDMVYENIIEIPTGMYCNSLCELEGKIYSNFEGNYNSPSYLQERINMATTNDIIQECNFQMIETLPNSGDLFISKSHDVCLDENNKTLYDAIILNKLNVSGLPPHRLPLNKMHISFSFVT